MVKKFEKVKDELLDHDYDGIQELDNELPPWWLWLFYITIIWGVIYMVHYHVLGTGPSSAEEYQQEMLTAKTMYQKPQGGSEAGGGIVIGEDQVISPLNDEESLAEGKAVYNKNCIPCHGVNGEGGVGPNMTDEYWIHGATMNDMVRTIVNGVPAKGMVPWGPILNRDEIIKVTSHIRTLRGTNPPNGKAPQGEKVDYSQLEN